MDIKVSDLRKFKDLASHVRRQKNLDIDSYVRFGGGAISKNAYESCIKFDCADANEDFLIHEDDLYPLISGTASPTINIVKNKKGNVIVSDGRDKFPALTTEFQQFLQMPDIPTETIGIDGDFLSTLGKAWPMCAPDENQGKPFYAYVHVGNETICSGDGVVAFMHPISQSIKIPIKKEVAAIVSKNEFDSFSESDAFYFFHAPGLVMGFRKTVILYADLRFAFECKADITFTYATDDLKSFNVLFMKRSKSPVCSFVKGGLTAYDMYVSDKVQKRDAEQITVVEEFSFNPEKTNRLMDSMGVQALDFHKGKDMYYVKSTDTKSVGIIARVMKVTHDASTGKTN